MLNWVWVSCAIDKKECILGSKFQCFIIIIVKLIVCCLLSPKDLVWSRVCAFWRCQLLENLVVEHYFNGDRRSVCGSVLYSSTENFVGNSILWSSLAWCVMITRVYCLWWSTLWNFKRIGEIYNGHEFFTCLHTNFWAFTWLSNPFFNKSSEPIRILTKFSWLYLLFLHLINAV